MSKEIAMVGFALIQIEEDIKNENFDGLENFLAEIDYDVLTRYCMGDTDE